jgi:hypothetical protein
VAREGAGPIVRFEMLSGFGTRSCHRRRPFQKILSRSDQKSHAERQIDGGVDPHKSKSSVQKKVVIRHAVLGMWMMRS